MVEPRQCVFDAFEIGESAQPVVGDHCIDEAMGFIRQIGQVETGLQMLVSVVDEVIELDGCVVAPCARQAVIEVEIERDASIASQRRIEARLSLGHDWMPIGVTVDGAMQRDRIGYVSAQCGPDRATMKIREQRADRTTGGMRREQEMGDVIQGARALASGAAAAAV